MSYLLGSLFSCGFSFSLEPWRLQPKVPAYVVRILEKQAEFRTPEDLETIADLMDGLQSFRKYSRQMQLSMCRIVRYMKLVLISLLTL